MTSSEIKLLVVTIFDPGYDKWFDYADEFIKLAEVIEKCTIDRCADHCKELNGSATLVAAIRDLKK